MGSFSNNPPNVKALFWTEDFKKCSTIDLMQCKDTHNNVYYVYLCTASNQCILFLLLPIKKKRYT